MSLVSWHSFISVRMESASFLVRQLHLPLITIVSIPLCLQFLSFLSHLCHLTHVSVPQLNPRASLFDFREGRPTLPITCLNEGRSSHFTYDFDKVISCEAPSWSRRRLLYWRVFVSLCTVQQHKREVAKATHKPSSKWQSCMSGWGDHSWSSSFRGLNIIWFWEVSMLLLMCHRCWVTITPGVSLHSTGLSVLVDKISESTSSSWPQLSSGL